MSWLSRLFRRKRPEDMFIFDAPDQSAPEQPWIPVAPSAREAAPATDNADKLGFSASTGTLLGGGGIQGRADRRYRLAFTPAQPVAEVRRLAGRTALIRRIIRSIEDQDLHVVLYGDRGIGKTSVLKVIQGLATGAGYLVHYVSCGQSASFPEVMRSLARRIPLLYDGASDPTASEADSNASLADRLPAGDFSVSQLTEVLGGVEGARILLILDEFDRSDVEAFRRSIGELIKNLSDRSIRVQLLIGGVAANLSELVAHVPSIRRNIVGIGVPNLGADEVAEMVDIAELFGGIRFDALARQRLADVSAGLPYLVGLIGQHAVLEAADAGQKWVARGHIDRAVEVACEEIASRLSLRCNYALDKAVAPWLIKLFERAADEATRAGGVIIGSELTDELKKHASAVADILQPIADDPRGGWRFVEDGTASLIWLRKANGAASLAA